VQPCANDFRGFEHPRGSLPSMPVPSLGASRGNRHEKLFGGWREAPGARAQGRFAAVHAGGSCKRAARLTSGLAASPATTRGDLSNVKKSSRRVWCASDSRPASRPGAAVHLRCHSEAACTFARRFVKLGPFGDSAACRGAESGVARSIGVRKLCRFIVGSGCAKYCAQARDQAARQSVRWARVMARSYGRGRGCRRAGLLHPWRTAFSRRKHSGRRRARIE